jgi:hypothetical protein
MRNEALEVVAALKLEAAERYFPPYFIALIYLALGERDEGFRLLEQAFEERSAGMVFLDAEPMFDGVRDDPRFEDLRRRVGVR